MIIKGTLFKDLQFVLDFPFHRTFKFKEQLKKTITNDSGIISYIINKNTNFLIRDDDDVNESYKCRRAVQFKIPVVTVAYIEACLEAGVLLDCRKFAPEYLTCKTKATLENGVIHMRQETETKYKHNFHFAAVKTWAYKSEDGPSFHQYDHAIAKVIVLQGQNNKGKIPFALLEIHVLTDKDISGVPKYCVFVHHGHVVVSENRCMESKDCRFFNDIDETLLAFQYLHKQFTNPPMSMKPSQKLPFMGLGSDKFHADEWLPISDSDPQIAYLVNHIWSETLNEIEKAFNIPIHEMKWDEIENAKMLLQKLRDNISKGATYGIKDLNEEYNSCLSHKEKLELTKLQAVQEQYSKCQMLQDVISLNESIGKNQSVTAQYQAMHCHLEVLNSNSDEFQKIVKLIKSNHSNNVFVDGIYKVQRRVESCDYKNEIGNEKMLFRATEVKNVVGILSLGARNLNIPLKKQDTTQKSFSDGLHFTGSLKLADQSNFKGTRMAFIHDVALGHVFDAYTKESTDMPDDCHSIHCHQSSPTVQTEFEDDEFIIFNSNQQKIKYLVEYHLQDDVIQTKICDLAKFSTTKANEGANDPDLTSLSKSVNLHHLLYTSDATSRVKAGLQTQDSVPLPLKSVHVRAKIIDLAAEITLMQEFQNNSEPIKNAKYVFPLDEKAVVCGFEAFTEGRHFVGRVEEKAEARKEYHEAVEKGEKAFLMEEESMELFSVSIGNISSNATVMTKITFVSELEIDGDLIHFKMPGFAASSPCSDAEQLLSETLPGGINLSTDASDVKTSLEVFVEMPFPIRMIMSSTHKLSTKKTETMAVTRIKRNTSLEKGFQLHIGISEIHKPRMWVEENAAAAVEACMLVFYPEFDVTSPETTEIIIAIDASNSMAGKTFENAQEIALLCLHFLPQQCKFNVVKFGTVYEELFPVPVARSMDALHQAEQFVLNIKPQCGNTEIRHLLQMYYLIEPSINTVRNLFLISDGYFNCADELFAKAREHRHQTRIFCLGTGAFTNRQLLRGLSFSGGGVFQCFDSKLKYRWESKVQNLISYSQEPVLADVTVDWQQFECKSVYQAPKIITSVFNGSQLLVYGFVPNCTLATLKAYYHGYELNSKVSTTELGKTRGTTLSCLCAHAMSRDWELGCLALNRTEHEILKNSLKPEIIRMSKQFNIVTSLTSFVAREGKDESGSDFPLTMEELVKTANIDSLNYLQYEDDDDDNPIVPIRDERQETARKTKSKMQSTRFFRVPEKAVNRIEHEVSKPELCSRQISPVLAEIWDVKDSNPGLQRSSRKSAPAAGPLDASIQPKFSIKNMHACNLYPPLRPEQIASLMPVPAFRSIRKAPCSSGTGFGSFSHHGPTNAQQQADQVGFPVDLHDSLSSAAPMPMLFGSCSGVAVGPSVFAPQQSALSRGFAAKAPAQARFGAPAPAQARFGAPASFFLGSLSAPPPPPLDTKKSLVLAKSEDSSTEKMSLTPSEDIILQSDCAERDRDVEENVTDDLFIYPKKSKRCRHRRVLQPDTEFTENRYRSLSAGNSEDMIDSDSETSSSESRERSTFHFRCDELAYAPEDIYESVVQQDVNLEWTELNFPRVLCKQLPSENAVFMHGGLPLATALLKAFPATKWVYKDVWMYKSRKQKIKKYKHSEEEFIEDLEMIFHDCNDLGGFDANNLSENQPHFMKLARTKLQATGIQSLGHSVLEAIESLLSTLVVMFQICNVLKPEAFPVDLGNSASIAVFTKDIVKELFTHSERVQFGFYALLKYLIWLNQSHPMVYQSLGMGNCWEMAFQNLLDYCLGDCK